MNTTTSTRPLRFRIPDHPCVGRALLLAAVLCSALAAAGCERRGGAASSDVYIDVAVEPQPPVVGPATVTVTLLDAAGQPLEGAEVEVEGDMSHAGMAPVIAAAVGGADGRYVTDGFRFTMAGDWFFVVRATLSNGTVMEKTVKFETPVRPADQGAEPMTAGVRAEDVWARPAAAGENGAVYMRLVNDTATADRLVAASSDIAANVEMHETKTEGDVVSMAPVDGVDLAPHVQVAFEPGGLHVMLVELKRDLQPGDRFDLTLELASGVRLPVEVAVRQP